MKTALVAVASPSERPYLDEWLEYHRKLGFSEVFLALDRWDYSGRFLGEGWLHLSRESDVVPGQPRHRLQMDAYNGFLRAHGRRFDWAAFIDIDEFIVLKNGDDRIGDFLGRYADCPGICLSWRMFGDSGLAFDGNRRVLERFVRCQGALSSEAKTLLNLRFSRDAVFEWMHAPTCWRGIVNVAKDHVMDDDTHCFGGLVECRGIAYLAHFYTKTEAEFREKAVAGRGWSDDGSDTGLERRMRLFGLYRGGNEEEDCSARDFMRNGVFNQKGRNGNEKGNSDGVRRPASGIMYDDQRAADADHVEGDRRPPGTGAAADCGGGGGEGAEGLQPGEDAAGTAGERPTEMA